MQEQLHPRAECSSRPNGQLRRYAPYDIAPWCRRRAGGRLKAVDRRWRYATTTTTATPRCPRCLLRDGVRPRQAAGLQQAGRHSSCGTCRPYDRSHHHARGPHSHSPSSPKVGNPAPPVHRVAAARRRAESLMVAFPREPRVTNRAPSATSWRECCAFRPLSGESAATPINPFNMHGSAQWHSRRP
jgi:hypothetical protein